MARTGAVHGHGRGYRPCTPPDARPRDSATPTRGHASSLGAGVSGGVSPPTMAVHGVRSGNAP